MSDSKQLVTEPDRDAAAAPLVTPVSKWAIHRHMYDWVVGFAHKPYGTWALGIISFAESSFFPIPPDVLLGPMCLGDRRKAWWFATVTTLTSVAGAMLGYLVGFAFIGVALMIPGITQERIDWLAGEFDARGTLYVFIAALTPIPFKLLTITSGVAQMNIPLFIAACLVGRSARFYGVAFVFWLIGPRAVPIIDRYFNLLCVVFTVLLVGGFYLLRYMR
jgi:membrane protein YqaA with SNARE-associated domain